MNDLSTEDLDMITDLEQVNEEISEQNDHHDSNDNHSTNDSGSKDDDSPVKRQVHQTEILLQGLTVILSHLADQTRLYQLMMILEGRPHK